MKPHGTELRFTQSEVRHITCLLIRNQTMPDRVAGTHEEWKRDHESLARKFHGIDGRFRAPKARARRKADA